MRRALLITASREWSNVTLMERRLQLYPTGTTMIHGGARGGDTIADRFGRLNGFIIHLFPYFSDKGNQGGHARNACMFDALLNMQRHGYVCTMEAFPLADVLDGGTRGMIELVERYNRHNETTRVPFRVTDG